MSDGEETWRHVITDESQRHLPDAQYYSLPRQVSHRVHTDTDDPRKASTLPRRHERSRSGGPKSAKTETETTSKADLKGRKEKLRKSSIGDLQLLETVAKITTAFETETTPLDVTYDVIRGKREASKSEDVCDPVRGSVAPVFRRGRRSRPSVVAGRRSSTVAVARRGKSAAARKAPSSSRVPPVGAAATPVRADGPAGAACWATCLDSRDSDEDSYVTACNSTPLLSRSFSSSRKDRASQHPDNNRKSYQAGNSSRRRRRRLKSPSAYDAVGEKATVDQPAPQVIHEETTIMFVPIPVIVVLLFLYVIGGTVMFHQLYGVENWSTAAYISLAAMLTVGGWYPDRRTDDADAGRWMWWPPDARFVYAMWVVVGLAMVSACLRLTVQTLSYCTTTCRQSQSAARSQP